MKVTKKMIVFLAGIFLLTLTAIFYNYKSQSASSESSASLKSIQMTELPLPQQNTRVDPNVLPTIPQMPSKVDDNNVPIANFPDLDRMPLDDETISLLPANESIANNYKDWYGGNNISESGTSVDKELYAKGNPLFSQTGKVDLVPLDVNSEKRRINFY
jgi:hypothetical protein